MQTITREFTDCSTLASKDADMRLESACRMMKGFLDKKNIKADVFVLDREDTYPIMVLTPRNDSDVTGLCQSLQQHACHYHAMPGITLTDVLCPVEKQGNLHWGVMLNASQRIVQCLANTLYNSVQPMDTAPARRIA